MKNQRFSSHHHFIDIILVAISSQPQPQHWHSTIDGIEEFPRPNKLLKMNTSSRNVQAQLDRVGSRTISDASRFACSDMGRRNPYHSPKSVLAPFDSRLSSSIETRELLPLHVHRTEKIKLKPRNQCHFIHPAVLPGNPFEDSEIDFFGQHEQHTYQIITPTRADAYVDCHETDWAPNEWRNRTIELSLEDIPTTLMVPEL